MPETQRHRLPSIRSQITLLVLACALPTVIGFGAVVSQFYQRERQELMEDTQQSARMVAAAIDRDLLQADSAVRALATSPSLRGGDLAALRLQAGALLGPQFPAAQILLSDPGGKTLLNVGAPLPDTLNPANNQRRLAPLHAKARAQLSVVYIDGSALLAVDVPVFVDGRLAYALTALLKPERLANILSDEKISRDQAMTLYDPDGVVVAQAGGPRQSLGQPAEPALRARLREQREALLATESADGTPVYFGFSRSPVSHATVAIATRQDLALRELLGAIAAISLAMAAVLLAGFSLAWWVGGRIARSVGDLVGPAQALASGSPFTLGAATFREAEAVGLAFRALEGDLRRNQAELEQLVADRTVQLEKNRAQLETLYATAPVGLSYVDSELRFVRLNDYLAALNRQPVIAHLGRHVAEMIPDAEVRRNVLADYRAVLDSGRPLTGLQRSGYPAASPGQLCHWVVSYYPQFGTDGRIIGITGLLMDVTELKRVEAELRQSRQLMSSVVENMPAMIFLKRAADLRYEMFNRYGAQLYGHTRGEELIGKSDYDFVPAAEADFFTAADRRVLAAPAGEVTEVAEEPITTGGVTRYLTTRKVALRDEHGVATHVLGISLDITERKQAKEVLRATVAQLAQSEHFVRTVTDNLPGMVAYWDASLHCRFANRYFLEWHGRSAEQMLGALMPEVLGEEQYALSAPYVRRTLDGEAQGFAGRLHWPSGDVSHTWVNYIPDVDERGQARGFFVLVSDITELKETELHLQELNDELVLARDRAEAASRAKSEFLANMSHEIRTPMNAIIGLARLLEEAPMAARERGHLDKIQLATQSLLGLVNDVLDFSRVEAGQLVLEHAVFSLEHILDSIVVLVGGSAHDKGIELVYDIDPLLPAELAGDPMRLQQVLLNLLSNAIKFTAHGAVVLQLRQAPGDTASAARQAMLLEFRVRDTGIGIPPEQQAHIFEAFAQADGSTSRQFGGAGLGLAICRQLADMMGGAIEVRSEPGVGSEFLFTCPFECIAPAAAPPAAGGDKRVLIVDDSAAARAALQSACDHLGWVAVATADAAAALVLLQDSQRLERPYDLLLLDRDMPDMDGPAMLAHSHAKLALALPPVLMMVAEPVAAIQARLSGSLGVAAILSKPVTPARLAARVAGLQAGADGAAGTASTPAHTPLQGRLEGMRILLVEDNQINQEVAQYILVHAGAVVETVGNGQLAVDLLRAAPQRCDVVLMDVQMPVLNGYDATAAIRAGGGALAQLPVVAMTANVMEDDRRRATEAGMNAHVAKPIDVDELIAVLTRLAGGRVRGVAQAPRAPAAAGQPRRPAWPALPGIDIDTALARLGGDHDALVALLKRFEQSQGGTVAEVQALLAAGQRQQAAQSLHRLRGVAANLGATEVASLTAAAEAALKHDADTLQAALAPLEHALQRVAAGARQLSAPPSDIPTSNTLAPDLPQKLAELQSLLQNNNLKALEHFQQLRPALAAAAPARALAEAVETLNFKLAQKMVEDMLQRKESA